MHRFSDLQSNLRHRVKSLYYIVAGTPTIVAILWWQRPRNELHCPPCWFVSHKQHYSSINLQMNSRQTTNMSGGADDEGAHLFRSQFHREYFDVIKKYEDEFKTFVLDVSGDETLYTMMMEKLLISTVATSLKELDNANTESSLRELEDSTTGTLGVGARAASTADSSSEDASSGRNSEDEEEDEIAPLSSDGSKTRLSSRQSSACRRQSVVRRSTIRVESERRRSEFQAKREGSPLEAKLSDEISYRSFLEDEITELERLLDDQEEEIAELDVLVARYKAKNEALSGELKTKKRTIMILEEKYSLLKGEHGMLRAKNEKLEMKLLQAEEERDMRIMSLTCVNDSAEEDMKNLRNEIRDCKESQETLQTIVAEKETALLTLANEMDSLKREMRVLKKQRACKEGSLDAATPSEVRTDVRTKKKDKEATKEKKEKKARHPE